MSKLGASKGKSSGAVTSTRWRASSDLEIFEIWAVQLRIEFGLDTGGRHSLWFGARRVQSKWLPTAKTRRASLFTTDDEDKYRQACH
ncbi:hypothetical protein Hypma_006136 [Hypsizygus marmoreus]|uniref:Uncharacterized protein n=1 Tax=Hypsizygus marmoreus TaxID=39966 RepID=A0A369JW93_HYPMA|nr:hypothetical protein Hypma_006136 [Hypsizygus marmoreus]